jgi:hypothetical protein
MAAMQYTYAVLGRDDSGRIDDVWRNSGFISDVRRLRRAAPSGYRLGRRFLGLGLDAAGADDADVG